MAARRKSGGADIKHYESQDIIEQFEHIREPLAQELKRSHPDADASFTAKDLSLFVYALQQFQEDVLGATSAHILASTAPARIPAKLFRHDALSTTSPIYKILKSAYEFRHTQGWRDWDLLNPTKRTLYIELVSHIRNDLVSQGIIKNPAVALVDAIEGDERERLSASVKRLGGTVVTDISKATHIVHPSTEELESPEGEEWLRTLDKKDGKVLVHYWYYPDSYDEWLPENIDFMDPEPAPEHAGAWSVSTRWIRDSAKYNEWMNEEDYEPGQDQNTDNDSVAGSPAPSTTRYGKRDNSDLRHESVAKRLKRSSSSTPMDALPDHPLLQVVSLDQQNVNRRGGKKNEFEPIPGGELANIPETPVSTNTADKAAPTSATATPAPESAKETTAAADSDAMDVDAKEGEAETKVPKTEESSKPGEAKPAEQESNRGSQPPETEEALSQADAERLQLEEEAGRYLQQQTQEVIIPSYAAWFNMAKIHEIEHKSLPEFFNLKNRSKTPTVYKDYRDFMINTYRLNPSEYLTVTACRRNLAGDVCAIIRVHAFLEQWGLINYQVDAETRPSTVGPSFTGHFRVTVDTPRGLQPFYPNVAASTAVQSNNELSTAVATEKAKPAAITDPNLELRRNIYAADATPTAKEGEEIADKKPQFNCFTCGTDCTLVRYHSIKTKNFELCTSCYTEGRFPSTMSSGDFIRMTSPYFKQGTDEAWTDQETLLLLEGLEMYDDDWNQISEHVGTRTREQCILHFLQLPIVDPYLNEMPEKDLGPLRYVRSAPPFSQADNPIMSVVAFLASVVNPGVAAAAAQSAIKEMGKAAKKRVDAEKAKAAATAAEAEGGANGKSADEQASSKEGEEKEKEGEATKTPKVEESDAAMDVDDTTATASSTAEKEDTEMKQDDEKEAKAAGEEETESPQSTLERVAAAALGCAAAKSKALASYEERELHRLAMAVVEIELKKLELKLQQFEELESVLEIEKRELERQRQQVYLDRLQMKKSIMAMQEKMFLARQTNNPQVFQSVTVPPGGLNGTGHAFQNPDNAATSAEGVRTQPVQQDGSNAPLVPPSRDANAEGVKIQTLP
ncbi:hypothetical protein BGW42_006491 [Actinomortierella wolfii]|nr:hypothetical protein BGW42_006491 [Actinomortierella wolfii]